MFQPLPERNDAMTSAQVFLCILRFQNLNVPANLRNIYCNLFNIPSYETKIVDEEAFKKLCLKLQDMHGRQKLLHLDEHGNYTIPPETQDTVLRVLNDEFETVGYNF
jgi:hypothetical protein